MGLQGWNLIKLGLTNTHTPDLGELSGTFRREHRAFCTSRQCGGGSHARKVPKPLANDNAKQCPDCGEYLFWKTVLIGE
jgi:hypothetical protein